MSIFRVIRAALAALIPAAAVAAEPRPNILWITCEDMSPRLGCYGDKFAATPNIHALARESVRYTRAFATAPACSPSRACLISGMYATSLGNPHLRCQVALPADFKGTGAYFRQAGYFTSNNVKTDYNVRDEPSFIAETWNRCDKEAHWRQREGNQPFFSVFNLMETHQSRTNVWLWEDFEREVGSRLLPGVRANPADVPLPPFYPDTALARRTMARVYDCIQAMDAEVGRILRELEDDGLLEDTIVFFYSDHGDGLPRAKRTLYDSGMQVPLLVRFPNKWAHLAPAKPREAVDRLVSFVDFAPTILSLAGLNVPKHFQGEPFLGKAAGAPRELVFGARDRVDEAYEVSRSVRDGRWLYIRNYFPHLPWMQPEGYSDQSDFRQELVALAAKNELRGDVGLYAAPEKAREELYDTEADPHQVQNLAAVAERAGELGRLRARLRSWILETRDLGFLPEQLMSEALADRTPWALGQDADAYPLERILAAAELVGDATATDRQMKLLADAEPGVRYWAAVGLRASRADSGPVRDALRKAFRDETLTLRIEAAGALVALDDAQSKEALTFLASTLAGAPSDAALHAGRTLELLGERARPAVGVLRDVWQRVRERSPSEFQNLYLRFTTEAALRGLGENVPRTRTL
jgi:N-sulfoglucosamine sulfohydrolase